MLVGITPEAVADLEQTRRLGGTLDVSPPIDGAVMAVPAVLGERVDDSEPLGRAAPLEPLRLEIGTPWAASGAHTPGARWIPWSCCAAFSCRTRQ